MIVDTLGVKTVGSDGFQITGSLTQNNIPILEENYVRKMNANNGFSGKRMFRFIGSNPIAAELEARQQGWNLDDEKEIYKYFGKNPDYLTVKAIDTGASGKIVIK
jgi:hypothetical protein